MRHVERNNVPIKSDISEQIQTEEEMLREVYTEIEKPCLRCGFVGITYKGLCATCEDDLNGFENWEPHDN